MSISEHKAFIEALIVRSDSPGAKLLRTEQQYSKAPENQRFNEFVSRLSPEDVEILSGMLEYERKTAFFDCLVELHERCELKGWRLIKDEQEIPHEPFGYTMFEEYLTLLDDGRGWDALI